MNISKDSTLPCNQLKKSFNFQSTSIQNIYLSFARRRLKHSVLGNGCIWKKLWLNKRQKSIIVPASAQYWGNVCDVGIHCPSYIWICFSMFFSHKISSILNKHKHLYNICTTSVQRPWRWTDVVQMLCTFLVFAENTGNVQFLGCPVYNPEWSSRRWQNVG